MRDRAELSTAEREIVRVAAEQILAHPAFRSSERSTKLFRYLLDRTLANEEEALKERRIGHEVFGREASYDTAEDPIVRNAASDTRKRLRQYDSENGTALPVRIVLAPGTYLLDFKFSDMPSERRPALDRPISRTDDLSGMESIPLLPSQAEHSAHPASRLPYLIAALAVFACFLFAAAFVWERQQLKEAGIGVFGDNSLWKPLLGSGKEVFVCLGHAQPLRDENASLDITSAGLQRITVTDLQAYTNISGYLQIHQQNFQMRTDTQTNLLDLRDRPIVLIGIGNNQWTQRLTGHLRFHFDFSEADGKNPARAVSVVDMEHPEERAWRVPIENMASASVDYAIAGRLLDPVTGGIIIYVAGAGPVGTEAASEYVTNPRFLRSLPGSLADPHTNVQVVLRTPIVGGIPGNPVVLATHIY